MEEEQPKQARFYTQIIKYKDREYTVRKKYYVKTDKRCSHKRATLRRMVSEFTDTEIDKILDYISQIRAVLE